MSALPQPWHNTPENLRKFAIHMRLPGYGWEPFLYWEQRLSYTRRSVKRVTRLLWEYVDAAARLSGSDRIEMPAIPATLGYATAIARLAKQVRALKREVR